MNVRTPLRELACFDPVLPRELLNSTNPPVAFMPMASVSAENSVAQTTMTRPAMEVSTGYTYFQAGDVLVAKITPCFENGKIAIACIDTQHGFGTTEFHVIRTKSEQLHAKYLTHFLRQFWVIAEGRRKMTGSAGQRRVPRHFLQSLQVPLPSLPEQRRIAAILDQAEALRAKRRQALAKLDTLTQSLFLEMFGDPLTNSANLPLRRIDSICRIVRGSSPRPQGDLRFYGGPIPRLMVADLTRDGFSVTPRIDSLTEAGAALSRPVPAGTVVMAVSGNVGLVSVLKVRACIHDGFVGFTELDEAIAAPRYLVTLLHLLKATHEQRKAGAIFQNLTTLDIKAMQIPIPDPALQKRFVHKLDLLNAVFESAAQSNARVDHLIASLQHRAFRGEL